MFIQQVLFQLKRTAQHLFQRAEQSREQHRCRSATNQIRANRENAFLRFALWNIEWFLGRMQRLFREQIKATRFMAAR